MIRKAFTLVELLVAIGIMAVVMGLAMVAFSQTRATSRDAQRKADLETVRSALELYRSDNGRYPEDDSWENDIGEYISDIPQDPQNPSRDYDYECASAACAQYKLCTALEVPPAGTGLVDCSGLECGENCNYGVASP